MNQAIEMLRNKAAQALDYILGPEDITLEIDPVEPVEDTRMVMLRGVEVNTTKPVYNGELSTNMMNGCNFIKLNVEQLNLLPVTKDRVWIYNISELAHTLYGSVVKELKVPACKDAEYAVATSLPGIMRLPKENVDEGELDYYLLDGRRAAMDLINPANLGVDQDQSPTFMSQFSQGNNYSRRGVFFSLHNPPLKKELRAAHKRMKTYYSDLMEKAKIDRFTLAARSMFLPIEEFSAADKYLNDSDGNK